MKLNPRYLLENGRVLLDATVLADAPTRDWIESALAPIVATARTPAMVVPRYVLASLDIDARIMVDRLRAANIVALLGDAADDAGIDIARVVETYRDRAITVLTQDATLAARLAGGSPRAGRLTVARCKDGALHSWPRHDAARSSAVRRFASADRIAGPPTALSQPVPVEGDRLAADGHSTAPLGAAFASGGEATVHRLGEVAVAKIYKAGRMTDHTLAKLERMTGAPLSHPALAWPSALLRDAAGRPVGYVMPSAAGSSIKRSLFVRKVQEERLPDRTRRDLVTVALHIAEAVAALHGANVVLGDINPENILVSPDRTITLVDLDSAQIEGWPCPVGTADCTRAVNQGKPFASYLRTVEDDRFSLAVIMFMVLLPGKHPFAGKGGGAPGENIRRGYFPYAQGGRTTGDVPDGPWRLMWGHLSKKVKDAFEQCFAEDQPLTPEQWMATLRRYGKAIEEGRMDAEQGDLIYPTRSKKLTPEVQARFGIHQPDLVERTCPSCDRPFEVRANARRRQTICDDCEKAVRLSAPSSMGKAASPRPASRGTAAPANPGHRQASPSPFTPPPVAVAPTARSRGRQPRSTSSTLGWVALAAALLTALLR